MTYHNCIKLQKLFNFVTSILYHVKNMIKKYMGENVKKYIYCSDKWK